MEVSEKKVENKDFAAAESLARQAVTLARDSFKEGNILQARSNLQLGMVNLKRGFFAQARKPIEVAQKVAEANSDHWLRAQIYGAQADLCFIQGRGKKERGQEKREEGKKWRSKQEKEEKKARQKDLAAGPAYEPIPPLGGPGPLPPMRAPFPNFVGGPPMPLPMQMPVPIPMQMPLRPPPQMAQAPRILVPQVPPAAAAQTAPASASPTKAAAAQEGASKDKGDPHHQQHKTKQQEMIWTGTEDQSMEEKRSLTFL